MRKALSIVSSAALLSWGLLVPTPALADAYDDCVAICIDVWLDENPNLLMYEFCRSECERKYPPGVVSARIAQEFKLN